MKQKSIMGAARAPFLPWAGIFAVPVLVAAALTACGGGATGEDDVTAPWSYTLSAPSRSACGKDEGKVYQVGPTRGLRTPKDVPWVQLAPCDQVQIDYRPEPYTDVVFIAARGAKNKYITIQGLPGPKGERPVFDGANATTSTAMGMKSVYDGAGMVVVGKPGAGAKASVYGYKPGYLHITGLHIRNARHTSRFTGVDQQARNWPRFTSGISVNPAEYIAITNCELADNGLGLFVNSLDNEAGQSRWLLVSGNHFHGNGVAGEASMHNAYTEAIGTIYEFNYFDQPVAGTAGDNVKERSAGIVFRYNYLEGGVYGLSLRDPQSNGAFEAQARDAQGDLLTQHAFVYGNVLRLRGSSSVMIGHGDGAYGDGKEYRHGKLFFYNNKVVSDFDYAMYHRDSVGLFQFLNRRAPTTAVATNNILYAKGATPGATVAPFSIIFWQGLASFQNNWVNHFTATHANWGNHSSGVYIGTRYDGSGLNGMAEQTGTPGFADLGTGDYAATTDAAYTQRIDNLPEEVVVRKLTPGFNAPQTPPRNSVN